MGKMRYNYATSCFGMFCKAYEQHKDEIIKGRKYIREAYKLAVSKLGEDEPAVDFWLSDSTNDYLKKFVSSEYLQYVEKLSDEEIANFVKDNEELHKEYERKVIEGDEEPSEDEISPRAIDMRIRRDFLGKIVKIFDPINGEYNYEDFLDEIVKKFASTVYDDYDESWRDWYKIEDFHIEWRNIYEDLNTDEWWKEIYRDE